MAYEKLDWSLNLDLPDGKRHLIGELFLDIPQSFKGSKELEGFHVDYTVEIKDGYRVLKANVYSIEGSASCFLSLGCQYSSGKPYTFNGAVKASEIFRQSPHDTDAWIVEEIARQDIPLIAIQRGKHFSIALCDTPAFYDNYTSQSFLLKEKALYLSSGDNGNTPGLKPSTSRFSSENYNAEKSQKFSPGRIEARYHETAATKPHTFEAIIFDSDATSLGSLRQDINKMVTYHFSKGAAQGIFGSLAFSSAWMNLRRNETGKSKYWVVPSIEYSNVQYCRDAFWIATMLPSEYDAQCLQNELSHLNHYAEYPLFVMIWAYRNHKQGLLSDTSQLQMYANSIEDHVQNGWFHSYDENDGRHDFQYWADQLSFEVTDVVTYNQGLFTLALMGARAMGLHTQTDPETAHNNYKSLFNKEAGFYPISKFKNTAFGPDPLLPDLLAQLYFEKPLVASDTVKQHYRAMIEKNRTKFGFKNVCLADGSYPDDEWYNIKGYKAQANSGTVTDGSYIRGGSWLLYDGVFLLDAILHGISDAQDQFLWRVGLDFAIGGTTFEYIDTVTGEAHKPNMGWNIALYAFVSELVKKGKIDSKLLETLNNTKTTLV